MILRLHPLIHEELSVGMLLLLNVLEEALEDLFEFASVGSRALIDFLQFQRIGQ
jgi:hypothetical protein